MENDTKNMFIFSSFLNYFITAVVSCMLLLIFSKNIQNFLYALKVNNFLRRINICEIRNSEECTDACLKIKSHCQDLSALGFDCEWVSVNGKQKPIALLQLATVHGLCCLFRLNIMKTVPMELHEILCDSKIIKLGISPLHDSKLLMQDYNVKVCSTLDLRYLYPSCGGLAALAASEIGVTLDKRWRIRASNWEQLELTDSQKDYAAKDAFVAIEIFKKWLVTKNQKFYFGKIATKYYYLLNKYSLEVSRYLDINFSKKNESYLSLKNNKTKGAENNLNQKRGKDKNSLKEIKAKSCYITRKSPLYHNCFMHAPDGELLCSCDRRKAQWYVEKGLAEVLPGEPYSIRLLFEPAARSGDTSGGRFYQHLKQNRCVVCGALESYLKHNVVPKEYRKHFPNVMKDHQSHDIVLMCVNCHHLASQQNEILRNALADYCNAPLTASKVTNVRSLQKVKNSAKALLNAGDVIPEGRKIYLENEIKKYYGVDKLSNELLETAANVKSNIFNEQYESHGVKVVNYFTNHRGGLIELEILWRMHFLDTMKPQYLPALWSITHNHARLAAKADDNQK